MSKRAYISRYLLIVKKLKAKPFCSYDELSGYIEKQERYMQMNDDDLQIPFSKRTLQRDLREIRNTFGIDVEFSRGNGGYFIVQNETANLNFDRMIEAFDMFNSLNIAQDLSPYLLLEKRRPQGTENMYGLLHAIKNKLRISFFYGKFWEEEVTTRHAEPYALKEFRYRWYVLAKDVKDSKVKSFALDRLTNLEIGRQTFKVPENYDPEESYKYCFGIISPNGEKPEDIILSFDPFQGKYIKTLPLHSTQKILIDNEEELRISLKLCLTHDFIMELLSLGSNVKVLKPNRLAKQVMKAHGEAMG